MKKKILSGIAVLAFAAIVGLNIKMNTNKNQVSDLALANVEALASGESGYSCTVTYDCGNGSVSCTGSICKRGKDSSGRGFVECDTKKTWC